MDMVRTKRSVKILLAALIAAGAFVASSRADENPAPENRAEREGFFAISGDAGYYTYSMNDVNNRFRNGGNADINGGMGYGGSLKLGLMNRLAAKVGIDYLFASRDSSRTVGGVVYNTHVELPATMVFIGGELVILPLPIMNLKLLAGYTLVSIYNGNEKSSSGQSLDFGTVTGTGSGGQFGAGLELFLAKGFSLEADLAYNLARIDGATFAGAPADPNSTNSNGSVDYSGLVAKLAFNVYLFR